MPTSFTTVAIIAGVALNIGLVVIILRTLRQTRSAFARDLKRLVWPLVDTVLTVRDREEGDSHGSLR